MFLLCVSGDQTTLIVRCATLYGVSAVALLGAAAILVGVAIHWCGMKKGASDGR